MIARGLNPMPKKATVKPYCSGTMTEAARTAFIKSALRSKSRRWKPTYECLKAAQVGRKVNIHTGKLAMHFECACCSEHFPAKFVAVDHIHPIVPIDMSVLDWNVVINNLFCEADGLQVLCKSCHDKKTKEENAERRELKNA